jgi:hypothetical protein
MELREYMSHLMIQMRIINLNFKTQRWPRFTIKMNQSKTLKTAPK